MGIKHHGEQWVGNSWNMLLKEYMLHLGAWQENCLQDYVETSLILLVIDTVLMTSFGDQQENCPQDYVETSLLYHNFK